MLDDRARLERQRRRVDALLWEGTKATAPRELLGAMERAYSLKELYLDHLIDVSGEMDHGPRLHGYDLDQRAQRFGVTGAVLQTTVMQVGPDLERVEAALASQKDTKLMQASSTEGAAVRSQRRSAATRANSPRPKEGVHG